MIKITYLRDIHCVKASGHALSGEEGKDLVCAAVSALLQTLAINCECLKANGTVYEVKTKLDKGEAFIKASAKPNYDVPTEIVFDTVCIGLDALAKKFPEYISYKKL